MRRIITTTTVMLLASTAMAAAADLAYKAPVYAPPVALDTWTSFYVGLSAGGGWGNTSVGTLNAGNFGTGNLVGLLTTGNFIANSFSGPGTQIGGLNQSGYTFGGFFGAQKQRGSWVLGLEADIDTTGLKATANASGINRGETVATATLGNPTVTTPVGGITATGTATLPVGGPVVPAIGPRGLPVTTTTTAGQTATGTINTPSGLQLIQAGTTTADVTRSVSLTTKIDELSSVRGKVGFIAMPNWMIYGTGGLALASTSNTVTMSQQIGSGPVTSFSSTNTGTLLGWTAGVGVDWKMAPDWVLGVLYQHYDFPKNTISFNGGTVGLSGGSQTADTVKARVSYHFMF
jgi:opacity protein-like surface antigen